MNLIHVVYMDSAENDEWAIDQPVRPAVGDELWLPDYDGEPVLYRALSVTLDLHADDFEIVCAVEKSE